ncbi:pyridoxal phosphate-dependent aminotransferase [Saccharopolyspora sp. ASAGF58]|uniref:pyridoxal phosphate-dependent aminotransferase n=1 Tax=Saccharopolyspora sp. ASAGF58 TaxID=2719023 RepID=UPI00143FBD85|nr:pyridoxal phosphate-dependent aminotransferase [Saccharopolyspora sp. ASAGF58]QIZ35100.1 pyridoxal phosphate-dependent aminotransferase [Saccharopolyspora sp. ASAGF58]
MVKPYALVAAQRANIPPFQVMEVLTAAAARQRIHGDVVSLAAGQPSTPAPKAVREAAAVALDRHSLGYTEQLGLPELRDAIAEHYSSTYGLSVGRGEVVVTTGASGGFLLAFLAAFDAGDRVALARPGYPAYRNILSALGCEVVELPCDETTRFQPTVEMLEVLKQPVQGLILASPANPTGTLIPADELARLVEWCDRNGVQLISDEIYHGITFGEPARSAREYSANPVTMQSFSKLWSMTGWRLGWMLVPPRLRRAVDSLTGNFTLCPPALSQHGAVAAFSEGAYAEVGAHVERYRINRELLLNGLADLGITRVAPADGAFYAWADIGHLTDDATGFCGRLLDETGVAVVPGVDFDPVLGNRFLRMSFAGSTEDIAEALDRLARWLPSAS